jgi:DNA-binding beta-propeller fold protein YncE
VNPHKLAIFSLTLLAVGVFSSAPMDVLHADSGDEAEEYLFYPLPPDLPRFQFLASFSSPLDVSSGKSGFRDFVFGGEDKEDHLVEKPYGVAIHEGAIHVVDTRGAGWAIFDLANRRSAVVRPKGSGTLKKPINITIDDDGTRYVTDTEREQVLVYDRQNRFLKAYGEPGQFKPIDVAIAGDRLYVTDVMHHKVHVLDKATGTALLSFGGRGSEPGEFNNPTNLTLAGDDTLYVVDTINFRVQQFSLDGEFIRAFGEAGAVPGTFSRPKGISVDRDGHIYVVDAAFENVQVFAQDGGALMFFGARGNERDSINMPTVVKLDDDNIEYFDKYIAPDFDVEYLVLVASQFGNNKVTVFGFGSRRD